MDGWMDIDRIDGWIDRWMDMDRIDGWMDRWMDGWVDDAVVSVYHRCVCDVSLLVSYLSQNVYFALLSSEHVYALLFDVQATTYPVGLVVLAV